MVPRKVQKKLDTEENREFWATCKKVSDEVATWPAWKRGEVVTIFEALGYLLKSEYCKLEYVKDCYIQDRGKGEVLCIELTSRDLSKIKDTISKLPASYLDYAINIVFDEDEIFKVDNNIYILGNVKQQLESLQQLAYENYLDAAGDLINQLIKESI